MKSFRLPPDSWLSRASFDVLLTRHQDRWQRLEQVTEADLSAFSQLNNDGMLLKFFLEQAFGTGTPFGKSLQILERDFGGFAGFSSQWIHAAVKDEVHWLVLALAFSDFRFHLFPVGVNGYEIPFCVSPMLCACVESEIASLSNMTRQQFAEAQLNHLNWNVVEQRIACLELPLNIFEDGTDCVDETCET